MLRLSRSILLFLVFLLPLTGGSGDAWAAPETPKMKVVVERLGQSLGGPRGGLALLERSKELDFVFDRTVRDSLSRQTVEASHRLVRTQSGDRIRLDVRVKGEEGIDSASIIDGTAGWVVADGERHEADAAALRSRLIEFAPERLFSVPLTLAAEGSDILGGAALELSRERIDGKNRLVLSGGGGESPSTRIVLDAEDYRPLEVAFRSLSGDLVYRYEDYREVVPGLVLPFVREFYRNGLRVSRTTVRRFGLSVSSESSLFAPDSTTLPKLPRGQ